MGRKPRLTVMGIQANSNAGKSIAYGLCNAVIISAPSAPFLLAWYLSYMNFDSNLWDYQSVIFPLELANSNPTWIMQLSERTFFMPLWTNDGIRQIYLENEYDLSENSAIHLWHTTGARYQTQQVEQEFCNLTTTYGRVVRQVLSAGSGYSFTCIH